jgi:antitoxin (DNA-binding transcriptional repressor) of toxin-antitoxin stability system
MRVGTRDLKNRLSHYLRLVRAGEKLEVTDRGCVIAELAPAPAGASDEAEVMRALANEGVVSTGRGRLAEFKPVVGKSRKLLSSLVVEDRG